MSASARSAAFAMAREDWLEWLAVLGVGAAMVGLEGAAPRHDVYLVKETMYRDNAYPLRSGKQSVPSWAVPIISLLLPAVALAVALPVLLRRQGVATPLVVRSSYRLILGLLTSVFLTGLVTNAIKLSVSRPRPSFLERCWPDWRSDPSVIKFRDGGDEVGGYPLCYGHAGQVEEGLKSFPSGHSSWTAAGLGFLSLALAAQLQVLGTAGGAPGRAWALLLALMPSAGAVAVAITRVIDYWHHPTDVGAGLLLGFGTAALSFAQLRHAVLPAFATATTGGGANGMPFGLISSPSKRNLSLVASAGPSSSAV